MAVKQRVRIFFIVPPPPLLLPTDQHTLCQPFDTISAALPAESPPFGGTVSTDVVVEQLRMIAQAFQFAVQDGIEKIQKNTISCDAQGLEICKALQTPLTNNSSAEGGDLDDVDRTKMRDEPEWWLSADVREKYKLSFEKYIIACEKMRDGLFHLKKHYEYIGGNKAVIDTCHILWLKLMEFREPVSEIREASSTKGTRTELRKKVIKSLEGTREALKAFHKSLYHQKHAFYFRNVRHWDKLYRRIHESDAFDNVLMRNRVMGSKEITKESTVITFPEFFKYLHEEFFAEAEKAMEDVISELQLFGEKFLPMFLAEEKERTTTRYANITTIATFFSSVTATTLQMSTTFQSQSKLWGVVNFFWFISLVFSVSSGVSSLLGMTWRKSSIYDVAKPPQLIRLWLDNAPMILLIISALTFIVGLNLFAYLSTQVHYVSLSTNAFTGVHSMCLFFVVTWLMYRIKHTSKPSQWIEGTIVRRTVAAGLWYRSDRGLHFRRNIFWAFGLESRVIELNWEIDLHSNLPSPSTIAKIIRCIVCPFGKVVRVLKNGVTSLIQCMMQQRGSEEPQVEENGTTARALGEFRRKLEDTFGNSQRIALVMNEVNAWAKCDSYDWILERRLWGYPGLVDFVINSELAEVRGGEYMRNEEGRLQELDQAWAHLYSTQTNAEATRYNNGGEGKDQVEDTSGRVTAPGSGSPISILHDHPDGHSAHNREAPDQMDEFYVWLVDHGES